jgi:anti-sigma factor RsiW
VITRLTATATLAHALVPSVTSHGFAAKVAKVGAVQAWATCGGLVDSADLDALKPERVSLSWLRELQAAVSSALSGAAPMAVDEPGEDSVGRMRRPTRPPQRTTTSSRPRPQTTTTTMRMIATVAMLSTWMTSALAAAARGGCSRSAGVDERCCTS